MKTVIFNTDTNQIESHHPDGYKVNGRPCPVEDTLFELPYTESTPPVINDETHYTTSRYVVDMELKQYRQVWEVFEKPVALQPQVEMADIIKIIIKKVVDGTELTVDEIITLKSYENENTPA